MADRDMNSIKFPGLPDRYKFLRLDPTLTQTGKAADAKEVGDRLASMNDDVSEIAAEGTVPTSEQMLSDNYTEDSVPYHFRRTASDNADREELEIVGGSVAWNQYVHNIMPTTMGGVEMTVNNDGSVTVNGTATVKSNLSIVRASVDDGTLFPNHVYFMKTCPKATGAGTDFYGGIAGLHVDNDGNGGLYKHTNSFTSTNVRIDFNAGAVFDNVKVYPQYIDLTLALTPAIADHIYALEQATAGAGVALFRSLFPKDYYPYDAGSMQSVSGLSEHKTVGFNQFDCELEFGNINSSGVNDGTSQNYVRSKNYLRVFPNTTYCLTSKADQGFLQIYVLSYRADKSLISRNAFRSFTDVTYQASATFTTSADCAYVRFFCYRTPVYTSADGFDMCINFSDTAKNGTYEPYDGHSYALDDSLTLRGIFKIDSNGNLYADGDIYQPSGRVTRRYGIVDLGTLSWSFVSSSQADYQRFYSDSISSVAKPSSNNNTMANAICSKYVNASINSALSGDVTDCFSIYGSSTVAIHTNAYSDVASFKTAMSGVMLVYELATPTAETADPYVSPQICSPYGTEEFVSTGIVPVGHVTKYPDNMRAKLDGLPWNFASLIAPTESGFKATRNYTTGALLIVNNVLYKATANIANGATITVGTNVTATTLAEVISALS